MKEDLQDISNRIRDHYPVNSDIENINKIVEFYFEFPPIIPVLRNIENRNEKYLITRDPLFLEMNDKLIPYKEELSSYNYFTYIKMK